MDKIELGQMETPKKVCRLNENNYQQVPDKLVNDVRDKKITPLDVVVWMAFSHHQRKKKNSWPSNKTIAAIIGVNERTIIRSINRLKGANHVIRHGKTRYGTRYTTLTNRVHNNKMKKCADTGDTLNGKESLPAIAPINNNQIGIRPLAHSTPTPLPRSIRNQFEWVDPYQSDDNKPIMIEGDDVPF